MHRTGRRLWPRHADVESFQGIRLQGKRLIVRRMQKRFAGKRFCERRDKTRLVSRASSFRHAPNRSLTVAEDYRFTSVCPAAQTLR